MVDINKLVRENILQLTPYSSARDEYTGKKGIFLDANENPFGSLNRYPDPYQTELKKAVSKIKCIAVDKIFLGNGSDEIIDLCFRLFCVPGRDKTLIFTPTYGMYEVSASINNIDVIRMPLDSNFQIDVKKAEHLFSDNSLKIIFICSPNNPTSNSMNHEDVEFLIRSFGGVVVIDEAYIDFSEKKSFAQLTDIYSNLIVMQTFSKAFGLASLRIGMAFADRLIIKYFNKLKPPYNISTINQKAALKKLGKTDQFNNQVVKIRNERERVATALQNMNIVEKVYPSDANFLLVKVKNANIIYNALISKNIIIRNRNNIIENCLRITIGKRSENNELIKALSEF